MLATVSSTHTSIYHPKNKHSSKDPSSFLHFEYEEIKSIKPPSSARLNTPVHVSWGQYLSNSSEDIYLCVTCKQCICIYTQYGDIVDRIDPPEIGINVQQIHAELVAGFLIEENRLVVYAGTHDRVHVYDRDRKMDIEMYQPSQTPITAIAMSSLVNQYQYIAIGTRTGEIYLIDRMNADTHVKVLPPMQGRITCIQITPTIVVAGDALGTVTYWTLTNPNEPVAVFDKVHFGHSVKSVCPSPVNKIALVSIGSDSTMIMYDLVKGKQLKSFTYPGQYTGFTSAAFRSDGSSLAIGTKYMNSVVLVDLRRPVTPVAVLATQSHGSILSVAFTPDQSSSLHERPARSSDIFEENQVPRKPFKKVSLVAPSANSHLLDIEAAAFSPVRPSGPIYTMHQDRSPGKKNEPPTSPVKNNGSNSPDPFGYRSQINRSPDPTPQAVSGYRLQANDQGPTLSSYRSQFSQSPVKDPNPDPFRNSVSYQSGQSPGLYQDHFAPMSPKPNHVKQSPVLSPTSDPTQFAIRMVRTGIEDVLMDVRDTLRADIRNMHVELLTQCDELRTEVAYLSKNVMELQSVRVENQQLKSELARLRVLGQIGNNNNNEMI